MRLNQFKNGNITISKASKVCQLDGLTTSAFVVDPFTNHLPNHSKKQIQYT